MKTKDNKILGIVIDCDYIIEDNKPIIRLFLKSIKSKKNYILYDDNFCPYFYAVPYKHLTKDQLFLLKKKIELFEEENINEILKIKSVIEEEKFIGLEKRQVLKIKCFIPKHIPIIKSYLEKYEEIEFLREFDILYYKRYLINNNIKAFENTIFKIQHKKKNKKRLFIESIEIPKQDKIVSFDDFKWLAFDLETIEEKGKTKIILASILTNNGFKSVISYCPNKFEHSVIVENEKELIKEMTKTIKAQRPDFILTYNGDEFDFKVILDRARLYNLKLDWGQNNACFCNLTTGIKSKAHCFGIVHIDIYKFVASIMRGTIKSDTLKLNNIAKELLGIGKKDVSYSDIKQAYDTKTNFEKIADYCLQDSFLTLELGKYIFANLASLCNLTNQIAFDVSRLSYGNLVESFAIKKSFQKNILVPNKPSQEEIIKRKQLGIFKGAFVFEPKPGIKKNIVLFDFRSLYPTIIITHNIDPFSINCQCCKNIKNKKNKAPDYDFYFCEKKTGFIPNILLSLIEKRIKIKKQMKKISNSSNNTQIYKMLDGRQYALKIIANAFYGYMGFAVSRYYDRRCGASTTSFGRYYIHRVIDEAEKNNFKVIYGDTDSVFLSMPKKNEKKLFEFLDYINNNLPGIMYLEYEGFFKRGIFARKKQGTGGAKKRYALIDETGKITIKGFEKVRRDWSVLAKETQKKILEYILNNKIQNAKEYIRQIVNDLKNKEIDINQLSINTNLRKNINSYDQRAPHILAAKKAILRGMKFKKGDNINYIITEKGNSISDKAQLAEFAKNYDANYYINNQIIPSVMRIFEAVGVDKFGLIDNQKQKNIFEYS
ncbi:MAG: hypothetical protein B6U87_01570 [Candidatus Aenigmarchaeota archaeon ex4484_52]|nr:MAG: hypothetical protein B6U87_01570 [Candidatus Aenigmarchaeota archaeon ex4484_52]